MEIHNLQDIENALLKTRKEFGETTAPIRNLLDTAVSQFLDALDLVRTVARDTDDERYALQVLVTAFRRVTASIVLLESGLPQEAHMILRNALEFMLVAIDITYNRASLEEWKNTVQDDLKNINHDEWHFSTSRIRKRIEQNEGNVYPEFERELAHEISEEWKRISHKSVHAHSQAQIRPLFDSSGNFQLLGMKTVENYERDFRMYQRFIFNIIALLIRIPKYGDLFGKSEALSVRRNRFAENYAKLRDQLLE